MNDIEKAIELLKTINQNMKVDHMTKDMWDGATEEETREYIEDFGLINLAVSALEKQTPKKPIEYDKTNRADCPVCGATVRGIGKPYGSYCSGCGQSIDWSVEE